MVAPWVTVRLQELALALLGICAVQLLGIHFVSNPLFKIMQWIFCPYDLATVCAANLLTHYFMQLSRNVFLRIATL